MSALEAADTRRGFLVCVVFVIERDGRILLLKRSRAKDHAPGEWEYRGAERRETIGISFHCRAAAGEVTLSEEHEQARWVPVAELANGPYPDWLRRVARVIDEKRDKGREGQCISPPTNLPRKGKSKDRTP